MNEHPLIGKYVELVDGDGNKDALVLDLAMDKGGGWHLLIQDQDGTLSSVRHAFVKSIRRHRPVC